MDCLVYIAASAALALVSKLSLQFDNVFNGSSDKPEPYPIFKHTMATNFPLLYSLFGLAGPVDKGDFLMGAHQEAGNNSSSRSRNKATNNRALSNKSTANKQSIITLRRGRALIKRTLTKPHCQ